MNVKGPRYNHQIKEQKVKVISEQGSFLGEMLTTHALQKANELGVDLIEISNSEIPTCKLIEMGKYLYQQKKIKQENKQPSAVVKELQLRPVTAQHDLETKLNQARQFIQRGDKVKFVIRFSGREIAHPDIAFKMLDSVTEKLGDIAKVEYKSRIEGKQIHILYVPN